MNNALHIVRRQIIIYIYIYICIYISVNLIIGRVQGQTNYSARIYQVQGEKECLGHFFINYAVGFAVSWKRCYRHVRTSFSPENVWPYHDDDGGYVV